jgi:predicted PurR-regulated permease PerM
VSQSTLNRDVLVRVFFFSAFAFILYQLFLLAQPFLSAVLGATTLAMTFYPLHERLLRAVPHPTWAALLSSVCVILLAVLPLAGLGWLFVRETTQLAPVAQRFLEELRNRDWPTLVAHLPHILQRAAHYVSGIFTSMNVDLKQVLLDNAQTIGGQATLWASQGLRNIAVTLLNALILSISLFFAFRDGERLLRWAVSLVPMRATHKEMMGKRVYETFRAVVVGSLVTAFAQGATALVGFLIAGVRLPVLLGIATGFSSMLGTSVLVTLPVAFSVMRESTPWGIFLLAWAIVVVGFIDNFLKPILIGSRAKMPFILIFFSIVGGVRLYGFLGFILGPMLVASFLSFVKIYREEYDSAS